MATLFTKSDKYTSEYACSIIRIGECFPIDGKDRIVRTMVNGESIVVRKDLVKEGDILFYASNETQLNADFLSANNLFESSSYELNSNADEVKPIQERLQKNKKSVEAIMTYSSKIAYCVNYLKGHRQLTEEDMASYQQCVDTITKHCYKIDNVDVDSVIDCGCRYIDELEDKVIMLRNEINNDTELLRTKVGFFNKNCRVKMIRFGGVPSMGYLFSLNEMYNFNPKVKDVNLEELVGEDFDTVDGIEFIKAYVPFVPQKQQRTRKDKTNKIIERFDRMIKGEFAFHYDTEPFAKNIERFKPTDTVSISLKLHGTSGIFGKVKVKKPIKLPFFQRVWNKFIDITKLFKGKRITDYIIEYGNVTSSRKVIRNQYINKDVNGGFDEADIWSEWGELLYPYLEEGMIVYGEIFGYVTGSDKMIKKGYDYGCEVGENKLMIYRITTKNENNETVEWEVSDVYDWTTKLIEEHEELKDRITPINILYHGTLGDLYKELDTETHWHDNLLEYMRHDTKRFGMEKREPLCKSHKVFREGIVIRIDNDPISEAYKLKCNNFLLAESKLMSDIAEGKEEISQEMLETYT